MLGQNQEWDFPGGSVVKNPPANAGDAEDAGSIPGLGRSPRGGNGNPVQYSCLGNPMDRGAWLATVLRVAKSRTWLSDWAHTQAKSRVKLYKIIKVSVKAIHRSPLPPPSQALPKLASYRHPNWSKFFKKQQHCGRTPPQISILHLTFTIAPVWKHDCPSTWAPVSISIGMSMRPWGRMGSQ